MNAYAATRDANNRPSVQIAFGTRADVEAGSIRFFVPRKICDPLQSNIALGGKLALSGVNVTSLESFQVKGSILSCEEATEADEQTCKEALQQLAQGINAVGGRGEIIDHMDILPLVGVTMQVEDIFISTPGPKAGQKAGEVSS